MLCFVFAALVVLLDQFFKRWIMITLSSGGENVIISGIISLVYVENTGAAFSILANQRWLLAGIAVAAAIILVFILLRYTEGFWGTLGLAAVLGGTVGNLTDRLFRGYVIDMFRTLFMNFAIFNIADIFITLGFLTFCLHFITSSIRTARENKEEFSHAQDGSDGTNYETYDLPDGKDAPDFDAFSETRPITSLHAGARYLSPSDDNRTDVKPYVNSEQKQIPEQSEPASRQEYFESVPEPQNDITSTLEALSALDALESELGSTGDLDVDKLLREYGFENDNH